MFVANAVNGFVVYTVPETYGYVSDYCEKKRSSFIHTIEPHVHGDISSLVNKVTRTIPEFLVLASFISGYGTSLAIAYSTIKGAWACRPLVNRVVRHWDFSWKTIKDALDETFTNLGDNYKKYCPALYVACMVAGVASWVLSISMYVQDPIGAFFSMTSQASKLFLQGSLLMAGAAAIDRGYNPDPPPSLSPPSQEMIVISHKEDLKS